MTHGVVTSGACGQMAGAVSDLLYTDLTDPERRGAAVDSPFSRGDSVLADAFTASCLLHATGERRWALLFERLTDQLADVVHTRRVDRPGLSNGLTGLLLLLDTAGEALASRPGLYDALERRVAVLAEASMARIRAGVGVDRLDYSYATGLSGVAHRLILSGRDRRLAERICDLFADLADKAFPDGFWTSASQLPGRLIEEIGEVTFGARDLSFGMGMSGVVAVLRQGAVVFGAPRYRAAAARLVAEITADLDRHRGRGISQLQPLPLAGEVPETTPPAGHTWSYGLPGLEFAVAGDDELMCGLYPHTRYGDDYFDPESGNFRRPGICNGVAGRLYLADLAGLPDDPRWAGLLEETLRAYVAGGTDAPRDASFWEGVGGAAAVWFGREGGRGYAPALAVLGARGADASPGPRAT